MTRPRRLERYALGASVRGAGRQSEGVGVARFARVADAPTVAEVAVLVVDAWQGPGVGRMLLGRLAARGARARHRAAHGIVLPDNRPIIRLLTQYAAGPVIAPAGDHLAIDVDLTAARGAGG